MTSLFILNKYRAGNTERDNELKDVKNKYKY